MHHRISFSFSLLLLLPLALLQKQRIIKDPLVLGCCSRRLYWCACKMQGDGFMLIGRVLPGCIVATEQGDFVNVRHWGRRYPQIPRPRLFAMHGIFNHVQLPMLSINSPSCLRTKQPAVPKKKPGNATGSARAEARPAASFSNTKRVPHPNNGCNLPAKPEILEQIRRRGCCRRNRSRRRHNQVEVVRLSFRTEHLP